MSRFATRARVTLLVLVAGAGAASACGTRSSDLLIIERSGSLPDAQVRLLVGDGGTVTCDGTERTLQNKRLLEARDLARDLEPLLARDARLTPPPGALLRYRVTGEQGEVRFADASSGRDPVLGRLIRFTRAVSVEACGNAR